MRGLLKSRKFWLAVAGVLVPILNEVCGIGLDSAEIGAALGVLAAAIIGIAWEDAAEKGNQK